MKDNILVKLNAMLILYKFINKSLLITSDPGEIRTHDTLIKSQLLYQLSYGIYRISSDPGEIRTHDTLIKSQLLYQLSYGIINFGWIIPAFPGPNKT